MGVLTAKYRDYKMPIGITKVHHIKEVTRLGKEDKDGNEKSMAGRGWIFDSLALICFDVF